MDKLASEGRELDPPMDPPVRPRLRQSRCRCGCGCGVYLPDMGVCPTCEYECDWAYMGVEYECAAGSEHQGNRARNIASVDDVCSTCVSHCPLPLLKDTSLGCVSGRRECLVPHVWQMHRELDGQAVAVDNKLAGFVLKMPPKNTAHDSREHHHLRFNASLGFPGEGPSLTCSSCQVFFHTERAYLHHKSSSACVAPELDPNTASTTQSPQVPETTTPHFHDTMLALLRWRIVYHAKDTLIQVMKVDLQKAVDSMFASFCSHLCETMCEELTTNIHSKLPACSAEAIQALARCHTNLWLGLETQRHELRAADAILNPLEPCVRVLGQKLSKDAQQLANIRLRCKKMAVPDLKAQLEKRGLDTSGLKHILVERLSDILCGEAPTLLTSRRGFSRKSLDDIVVDVSLEAWCAQMLGVTELRHLIMEGFQYKPSTKIRSVKDGTLYTQHPTFKCTLRSGDKCFTFILYGDDVGFSCPIGQFRSNRKVAIFYVVIAELPRQQRNKCMHLMSMCFSSVVQKYGLAHICGGYDSTDSSFGSSILRFRNGVLLRPSMGDPMFCFGDLFAFKGDGPFAAKMMRRKEAVGPSTTCICMTCDCQHEDMLDLDRHHFYTMDDHSSHQAQLAAAHPGVESSKLSSRLGSNLGLHFATHFGYEHTLVITDVFESYAWDLQHIEFEGLMKEHAYQMLHHLINDGRHSLNVDILNMCLSEYKIPREHKRPQELRPEIFRTNMSYWSASPLLWTSGMMMCFVFASVRLLEPYVDTTDEVWILWIKHVNYVAYLMLEEHDPTNIPHIQRLVLDHHHCMARVHPTINQPKVHWSTKLAPQILRLGPNKDLWCMAEEGEHQFFKNAVGQLNWHGMLQTLSSHHTRFRALSFFHMQRGTLLVPRHIHAPITIDCIRPHDFIIPIGCNRATICKDGCNIFWFDIMEHESRAYTVDDYISYESSARVVATVAQIVGMWAYDASGTQSTFITRTYNAIALNQMGATLVDMHSSNDALSAISPHVTMMTKVELGHPDPQGWAMIYLPFV